MKLALAAALVLVLGAASAPAGRSGGDCGRTSVAATPLDDLRTGRYHGRQGGLYPGGRNAPSAAYRAKGLAAAKQVAPIGGRIVLLSIGMSNTSQEFESFRRLAAGTSDLNPRLTIVNGAQGGQDAERIYRPDAPYWGGVDGRLAAAGTTPAQVQVVWLKQAIAGERRAFPADAGVLRYRLRSIVAVLQSRFPNLRLVYLSSRTYAGYATTSLNPEPFAYDSGFAVKWAIQDRIEGKVSGPWLAWGPYLWTNGTKGRRDGTVWECADAAADGTHPSPSGQQKVAALLLRFFRSEPTARGWFLGP